MKAFQNLVCAAVGLCALTFANAAALSDSSAAPSAIPSATPSDVASDSSDPISAVPTTSTDAGVPTTTDAGVPTTTGGYVVTGIYTTCLTLTFAAPTPLPTNPGGPIISASASDTAVPSDTPIPSDVNPGGPIQSVARRHNKHSSSLSINPGGPIQSVTPVSSSDATFPSDIPSGIPSGINPGGPIIVRILTVRCRRTANISADGPVRSVHHLPRLPPECDCDRY
ncbi:hypothetical protein B0H19DRAFT_152880 [Mycena capillaripes]|nr:hypothetical protein B0H19DRAFT_152880 [Mycena capillaripes]